MNYNSLLSCFPSLYISEDITVPFNSMTTIVDVNPLIRSDTLLVRLTCGNKCFCAVPSVSITRDYPILPMVNCQTYFRCNSGYEKAAVNSQKLCQQLHSQRGKQSLCFRDSRAANWQPSRLDLPQEAAGG